MRDIFYLLLLTLCTYVFLTLMQGESIKYCVDGECHNFSLEETYEN